MITLASSRATSQRITSPSGLRAAPLEEDQVADRGDPVEQVERVLGAGGSGPRSAGGPSPASVPAPAMLTDYHLHLRPDERRRDRRALLHATRTSTATSRRRRGGDRGARASPSTSTGSPRRSRSGTTRSGRVRGRRPRRVLRVRALDTAPARHRDGLHPRPRGPDREPARWPRLRLRRRLGALRRRPGGRRRRYDIWESGGDPDADLAALLRDPRRGGAVGPLRHRRPPRPGQGLGRRPAAARPATRASTTSRRSRRSPRSGSRSRSRPPAGESRSTSSIRPTGFAEMCVDAGAAFALSSDAHVPEEIGYAYDRAVERMRAWGVDELGRLRARRERRAGAARVKPSPGVGVGIGYDSHRFAAGRRRWCSAAWRSHTTVGLDRPLRRRRRHPRADRRAARGVPGSATSEPTSRRTTSAGATPTRSTCCGR